MQGCRHFGTYGTYGTLFLEVTFIFSVLSILSLLPGAAFRFFPGQQLREEANVIRAGFRKRLSPSSSSFSYSISYEEAVGIAFSFYQKTGRILS